MEGSQSVEQANRAIGLRTAPGSVGDWTCAGSLCFVFCRATVVSFLEFHNRFKVSVISISCKQAEITCCELSWVFFMVQEQRR